MEPRFVFRLSSEENVVEDMIRLAKARSMLNLGFLKYGARHLILEIIKD